MGNTDTSLPEWAIKIQQLRESLGENRVVFGKRFGVSRVAVWYWESGTNEPPAAVLMFVLTGKEPDNG